ncbi:hypothetical protein DFH08DRAFT_963478 [Mycena albidolilacea]|uniref:Uncharacterized protein n=1 Tax=Mycena albidolilacea TaxID=1033008 RepID=A0AAD7ENW4_9AGAR|nr:hypothetical protein DFH08DRAFT_963478 [Mycena albidolilacea]
MSGDQAPRDEETSILVLNVKDPVGVGLKTDGSAYDARKSLVDIDACQTDMAISRALCDLNTTYYAPGMTVVEHAAVMRKLQRAANNVGAAITDGVFWMTFIASLSESWRRVVHRGSVAILSTSASGLAGGKRMAANIAQTYAFAAWTVPAADISVYNSSGVQNICFAGEEVIASPAALMDWDDIVDAIAEIDVGSYEDPHGVSSSGGSSLTSFEMLGSTRGSLKPDTATRRQTFSNSDTAQDMRHIHPIFINSDTCQAFHSGAAPSSAWRALETYSLTIRYSWLFHLSPQLLPIRVFSSLSAIITMTRDGRHVHGAAARISGQRQTDT